MAIYVLSEESITPLQETTLRELGVMERNDLQRLLRSNISVIAPDTLVISEEFCDWEDSRRRIDLLGIDKEANLVVIELKRTNDGGHMELQAVRYAAMISTMTFDRAVQVYDDYLRAIGSDLDSQESLLEFLEWTQPDEDRFGQQVRIVLASADFSRELTTSILWLNSQGIDIRCVRLKPYSFNGSTLLDVQQLLPLPEAEDYQIKIREKQQREKAAKNSTNSLTRISLELRGQREEGLPARVAIFRVIKYLAACGVSPSEILQAGRFRPFRFRDCDGSLNSEQFIAAASSSRAFDPIRYFCSDEQLIHANGKTFAFSNQWTGENVLSKLRILSDAFPRLGIRYWIDGTEHTSTDN